MEKVVVNFKIDKNTKKEMEEICKDIGKGQHLIFLQKNLLVKEEYHLN